MFRLATVAAFSGVLSVSLPSAPAQAGADPFLGEIMMVGFNFCPRGWAETNGQLMPISQYSALFSLLGTIYGGDGRTTFALPNLQSRVPMGMGRGPGLSTYRQGQIGGYETVVLNQLTMPSHSHIATSTAISALGASSEDAGTGSPGGAALAESTTSVYAAGETPDTAMSSGSVTTQVSTTVLPSGGSQPFGVMQPYIAMKYCIALQGIFPSRS